MKRKLRSIILPAYSIERAINTVQLRKVTSKKSLAELNSIRWAEVEHLHLLGSDKSRDIGRLQKRYDVTPGCYIEKDGSHCWVLLIGVTNRQIVTCLSQCTENLEQLTVRFTRIQKLNLSNFVGLKYLDISKNEHLRCVDGLDSLHDLRTLRMNDTRIGSELRLRNKFVLEDMHIGNTEIKRIDIDAEMPNMHYFRAGASAIEDTAFLHYFPNLNKLILQETAITQIPELEKLSKLWHLNVISTGLSSLPNIKGLKQLSILKLDVTALSTLDYIELPENLVNLSLSGCLISRLPDSIRHLKKLEKLDISGLKLRELPLWLPELGLPFCIAGNYGINIRDTEFGDENMSNFNGSQDLILEWFEECKRKAGAPLNEVKVVFLGDGEAGKSHTIARLLNDGGEPLGFTGDATPGVVIQDKPYIIGDRKIQVHFWDFGGQEIFHSMHRMFLTERTMYVIIVNARENTQDDQARAWLRNIKSFANGAPVMLALNKMDKNPNASVNETDLRVLYPNLTEVVKLSAMYDSQEVFNVSFTEAMKRQIGKMKALDFFFPDSWTKVKHQLLGMKENYISGSDYTTICDECGVVDDDKRRRDLLEWFNDLGVSICYGDTRLRDYVILRPNWITNAVYAILFNKHPDTQNGIISHDAIFKMIQPPNDGDDPYRRTNPNEKYKTHEIEFILKVTRKFGLSFRVDDNHEFIPMLCGRDSLPIVREYDEDPHVVEFRMIYDYLPDNVLYRLMVELRHHLDQEQVWQTGARFCEETKGFSAVVKSEENLLRIFVRAEEPRYTADMYLDTIRNVLKDITDSLGLKVAKNQVVYKTDGIREYFNYDELLLSQELGDILVTSVAKRKKIPIADILGQIAPRTNPEQERLLSDIITVCGQVQDNDSYWTASEDRRNTCVRNLLRAKGYHVADQTFSGISEGKKQAGEVDLKIMSKPDETLTLYEGLNLSNMGQGVWNSHLKKLLENYNSNGLPFLFLVSYMDVARNKFDGVIERFVDHMKSYNPEDFSLCKFELLPEKNHYIQTAKCVYEQGNYCPTVYHIFVQMGL